MKACFFTKALRNAFIGWRAAGMTTWAGRRGACRQRWWRCTRRWARSWGATRRARCPRRSRSSPRSRIGRRCARPKTLNPIRLRRARCPRRSRSSPRSRTGRRCARPDGLELRLVHAHWAAPIRACHGGWGVPCGARRACGCPCFVIPVAALVYVSIYQRLQGAQETILKRR